MHSRTNADGAKPAGFSRRRAMGMLLGASATSGAMLWDSVLAQTVDQVRILYGFPAGSSGDIVSRRVAERIAGSSYARASAIVDNRPGAGGRIALELLKGAAGDGTTFALTPYSCTAVYPHVFAKLPYDPMVDFAPVSLAAIAHQGFAVGPLVPPEVRTLKDFIVWSKAHPQLANYGSPGAGTVPHFVGALFGLGAGIGLHHVPYRGSAPAVADTASGQVAAVSTPHGDLIAHHRTGKLRMLATSGASRSPFVPEVPTFAESGFRDVVAEEWFGFLAPASTPASVVNAASVAINQALSHKALIDGIATVGLIARGSTPQEMAASQAREFERWRGLVRRVGFTADS